MVGVKCGGGVGLVVVVLVGCDQVVDVLVIYN